jgi:hypothetical protein
MSAEMIVRSSTGRVPFHRRGEDAAKQKGAARDRAEDQVAQKHQAVTRRCIDPGRAAVHGPGEPCLVCKLKERKATREASA